MSRMEATDALAVELAQAGDRDAFRALVERHSRSLFRLAYRMTGNEHDAEEVVQEAFLRAYRRLNQFEARANFGTWLYRIAVNCSLDLVRARKRENEHRLVNSEPNKGDEAGDALSGVMAANPSPERLVLSSELGERILEALATLTENERAAFLLRHFEGLGLEEIGATLGLRENATKNCIFRAVQKMRRALEPLVSR